MNVNMQVFDILEHQAEMAVRLYLKALEDGGSPQEPVVAVQNAGYISKAQLQRAASGARAGRTVHWQDVNVTLQLDTTTGTASGGDLRLEGRISISPDDRCEDIYTGVSVSGAEVEAARTRLRGRLGSDRLQVVRLAQEGSYGSTVEIAADVDLSGLDIGSLAVYRADRETGELERLTKGVFVDDAGFLHFQTKQGGDIVVTDSAL